jgi:dienelactone hydrolase
MRESRPRGPLTRYVTFLLTLATAVLLAGLPAAATELRPVRDQWAEPGPYPVMVEPLDGDHTVYRPATLDQRHPVIIWGNGTLADPSNYDGLLRHWASHGFIVAAANTRNSGSGKEMLDGATLLAGENSLPSSVYYQKVDTGHIGATGHSQGGGGAIAAGADPRISTTIPIEPGPLGEVKALHSPMFILGGQLDLVVAPQLLVIPRYNAATQIPAVYGELAGATHLTPTGDGGGFRGMTTAWFRYWLMDDEQAGAEFIGPDCGLCRNPAWSDVRRNALVPQ